MTTFTPPLPDPSMTVRSLERAVCRFLDVIDAAGGLVVDEQEEHVTEKVDLAELAKAYVSACMVVDREPMSRTREE